MQQTPAEQERIDFQAECQSRGWRFVLDSDELEQICGERSGICHFDTIFGQSNHNDSIFDTWRDCFNEVIAGE